MKIDGNVQLPVADEPGLLRVKYTAIVFETPTADRRQAVQEFQAANPGARVNQIDGKGLRGYCPCGWPVLTGDNYRYDTEEETYICGDCAAKAKP